MLKDKTCKFLSPIIVVLYAGTEREDSNNNESQVTHEVMRSPNDTLDEIKNQQTHNLYCPKCKSNITKNAVLFVKNQEPDLYKTEPHVLWVPLVIPAVKFPTFHLSLSFLAGNHLNIYTDIYTGFVYMSDTVFVFSF